MEITTDQLCCHCGDRFDQGEERVQLTTDCGEHGAWHRACFEHLEEQFPKAMAKIKAKAATT